MQHKRNESNALFEKVFTMYNPTKPPGSIFGPIKTPPAKGVATAKWVEDLQKGIRPVLTNPRWQYYLARARYLNNKNGLRDADMPPLFVMAAQEVEKPRRN
jgi:hypothetical protein